jgi:hypothetical protein
MVAHESLVSLRPAGSTRTARKLKIEKQIAEGQINFGEKDSIFNEMST